MTRLPIYTFLTIAMLGCGSGDGSGNGAQTSRDSAGVAIVAYPAAAWDNTPQWQLSDQPLAVIGGDPDDAEIDLTTTGLVGILSDNRIVVSIFRPAQMYLFSSDGKEHSPIGSEGEGPGEYRFLSGMQVLPGDTIVVHEALTRKALFFLPDGSPAGIIQFPVGGTLVPPTPIGRLGADNWLFQLINPVTEPPADAGSVFRLPYPVVSWQPGQQSLDTILTLPGNASSKGSVGTGDAKVDMARPIAFSANSFTALADGMLWTTTGDHFEIEARDSAGGLLRSVRMEQPERDVTSADQERYKQKLREGLERFKQMQMVPSALIESELAKVDKTEFANQFPAIGQMLAGRSGRIWVTEMTPGVDSSLTYAVFDQVGKLLGKVDLPGGLLVAASSDRVVVRREDEATGLVRLEVWGFSPTSRAKVAKPPQ